MGAAVLTCGVRWRCVLALTVFGLFAGLLFAYDAYTIFLQLRSARQHTAASTNARV